MARSHSSHRRRKLLAALAAVACVVGLNGLAQASALAGPRSPGATPGNETRPFEPGEEGVGTDIKAPRSNAPSHVPSANVARPTPLSVAQNPSAKAFEGLSMKDQRDANGGNSFSGEPPDQGLCVGGSQVIEGVNDVFSIYSTAGGRSDVKSYVTFFHPGEVEIDRSLPDGAVGKYGEFVSDPKCYWDPQENRFFMTLLELGTDSTTGDFDGSSFVDIAVSRSATPTTDPATWHIYQLDVANDGTADTTTGAASGNLAAHSGCPCLGDQPLIGADRNGFFVTTNEFSIDGPEFNGAQVYAFDKAGLAAGTLKVQRIENNGPAGLGLAEGTAYSIQPATSPTAGEWSPADSGTEFALSALDFAGKFDNRVARWSFSNTASLRTGTPAVTLSYALVSSEVYGAPPKVAQRSGPYPLGQSLKDKLNLLDSNDDRMNQVVYSGKKLWSGVNTAVKTKNGPTTTGIAYFVVGDAATPVMVNQGYVSVNRNSVMYPSIGVGAGGANATMVFTLAGSDYYPSTAYVRLTGNGAVTGPVTVYGAGTKPADGFSGYPEYDGNGVERWGDYSAATADAGGTVWLAGEYIPGTYGFVPGAGTPPSYIANWGTAIGRLASTG